MDKDSTVEEELPGSGNPASPAKPESLSRYRTEFDSEAKIARGGYGKVVFCKNILDEMPYAVKKIPFNNDDREKVLREVRALARLRHKNVVRYYQAWIEPYQDDQDLSSDSSERSEDISSREGAKENCLYIQMEHCRSTLLDQLWGEIDKEKGWMYFQQIVEGVCYMHHKNIIHRDLSTQNILIDEDSDIKISDFGLAKVCSEGESLYPSGSELGNAFYRAPEMEDGKSEIDAKVDIFSLGIILFELLNFFPTQYERFKVLTVLRKDRKFPKDWEVNNNFIHNFILELLSENARDRPSAAEILRQRPWERYAQEVAPFE